MATVGTLAVNVVAKTAPFTKGMQDARQQIKGFVAGSNPMIGKMLKFGAVAGAAAAGILAVRAAVRGMISAFSRIDALAKASDSLGVTTAQLAGFQLGAELGGSSAEGMTKALEKMNKNLGDAAAGIGTAKPLLEEMGLSAENLAKGGAADALGKIADKIKALPTPAQQSAAAVGIFGRKGQELLPFLKQGSAGIGELAAKAKSLGLAVSDVDAQNIQDANDAITELKAAFKGLWNVLATLLAPVVKVLAKGLTFVTKIISGTFNAIKTAGRKVLEFFGIVKKGAAEAEAERKKREAAEKAAAEAAARLQQQIDKTNTKLQEQIATYGMTSAQIEIYKLKQAGATKEQLKQTRALQQRLQSMNDAKKAREEAIKQMEELKRAGEQLTKSLRTPMEVFNDEMTKFKDLLGKGVIGWETYRRATEKAGKALLDATEKKKDFDLSNRFIGASNGSAGAAFEIVNRGNQTIENARLREIQQAASRDQERNRLLKVIAEHRSAMPVEPEPAPAATRTAAAPDQAEAVTERQEAKRARSDAKRASVKQIDSGNERNDKLGRILNVLERGERRGNAFAITALNVMDRL